jgi:hypothetical protein
MIPLAVSRGSVDRMTNEEPTQPWPAPVAQPRQSQMDLWTGIIVIAVFTVLAAVCAINSVPFAPILLTGIGLVVGGAFIRKALSS